MTYTCKLCKHKINGYVEYNNNDIICCPCHSKLLAKNKTCDICQNNPKKYTINERDYYINDSTGEKIVVHYTSTLCESCFKDESFKCFNCKKDYLIDGNIQPCFYDKDDCCPVLCLDCRKSTNILDFCEDCYFLTCKEHTHLGCECDREDKLMLGF